MAGRRIDRIDEWRDRVDELCYDGERVEHRIDLERATIVVTTQRVLAFVPHTAGPDFRHVDRPNVGTVTVETSQRLAVLCAGIVAAFAGLAAVEMATSVGFSSVAPAADPEGIAPLPGSGLVVGFVETVLAAVEMALVALEWSILLVGVAAFVVAVGFVGYYVRSRARLLVVRVSGGEDLVIPVSGADLESEPVADLEAAIRPGSDSTAAREGRAGEYGRIDLEESG
ncbi:hypothetical protein E2L06_18985 [Haloterrigena sp. H1]|uniref:hypothetical protein n=1 Tax=Haloterrigena sp. H1 TaxID=2552943 RepID=UPI00110ED7F6|nr:hypothetical protein [Haloterrigena sp. H1]TMT80324.1 hypothetical protein E2L06_18985 [Haloterrigena sp. H1]